MSSLNETIYAIVTLIATTSKAHPLSSLFLEDMEVESIKELATVFEKVEYYAEPRVATAI